MQSSSFMPVVDDNAQVIVLGSMPGTASIDAQQYYGHPRNAFWPIMQALFAGVESDGFAVAASLSYADKLNMLRDNGVAVWDVMASCYRPGSLDASIEEATIVPNDFNSIFAKYANINSVVFNGLKAAQSFRRYVRPSLATDYSRLQYYDLPSTSPAHAAMSFEKKLEQWQQIRRCLA